MSDRVPKVDRHRLLRRLDQLATFGATEDGGVDRQALSSADIASRLHLIEEARSRDWVMWTDPIANLYVLRPGSDSNGAVMTGSHIDSQPTGGKLDGAYGVCAAWEVLAALDDADIDTAQSVMAVVWTNEEGCRFAPGSMGSAYFARPSRLADLTSSTDKHGVKVSDAVAQVIQSQGLQVRPPDDLPNFEAFIELHIEQGPELDLAGSELAVVDGIVGVRWYELIIHGRADHAGAAPLDRRADAVKVAAGIIVDVADYAMERIDRLRATVGSVRVEPDVPNTVAERARLTIDVRSTSQSEIEFFEGWLSSWLRQNAPIDVRIEIHVMMDKPATSFDASVIEVIGAAARETIESPLHMPSWAFHDAMYLADCCPTGMLFVPSIGGVSHHPEERTDPEHLVKGAEALTSAVHQLAAGGIA